MNLNKVTRTAGAVSTGQQRTSGHIIEFLEKNRPLYTVFELRMSPTSISTP